MEKKYSNNPCKGCDLDSVTQAHTLLIKHLKHISSASSYLKTLNRLQRVGILMASCLKILPGITLKLTVVTRPFRIKSDLDLVLR